MTIVDSETIGRRIAEARARARLTQAELAGATGLDRTALAKIETGARRITALELAGIAEHTGESFESFVTEPPTAVVSYRLGSASSTLSSIDRLLENTARNVELVQSLGHLQVANPATFEQAQDLAEATALATQARSLLKLDPTGPISDLVGPISTIGLFAFSADLGPDSPDAATTLLTDGGVSVINSDRAVGRRRLALAHELGHYLVADAYTVDWRVGAWANVQQGEKVIDAFARALLLPENSLKLRWTELTTHDSVRQAAVRIASEYRVDMSTLAARLSETNIADEDSVHIVRATSTKRVDIIEYDLAVAHDLEGTTLPRSYEKAILALFRSERISAARAVDLLLDTIDEASLPTLPPVNEGEIWKFTS